jgi:hypothetical protein
VGGNVTAWENANVTLPVCTSVGGGVDAGENAKVTLPVNVKKNDPSAARLCRKMLLESFAAAGFSFDDGILAKVVSRRGPVAMDYRKILKWYLNTVGEEEGVYFIGSPDDTFFGPGITQEEFKELHNIAAEIKKENENGK